MYRSAEDRMSRRALLGALLAVLAPLSALDGATANAVQPSDWDAALPALELRQVDLKAPSLEKAWQQLSTAYLVRSILYVEPSARTVAPFQFRCDRCRVRDIFAALVRAYPDFTWTADQATGLLWIHPKARPMSGILNERLRLVRPACAVPLQTGVLLPLAHLPGERITVARAGTAMTNTLDVATDLPAGEYRLRDLLVAACKAHPTKTFYLRSAGGRNEVTAVHLGTDLKRPPAGALLWWRLHFGAPSGATPSRGELAARLASTSADHRAAAREYLEAVAWQIDLDALVQGVPRTKQEAARAVWVAVGTASVVARVPQATHRASEGQLKALLGGDGLAAERSLRVLAELTRASLAGEAQVSPKVSKQNLAVGELSPILHDLLRLAHTSEPARGFVAARAGGWQGAVAAPRQPGKKDEWASRCLGDPAVLTGATAAYQGLP